MPDTSPEPPREVALFSGHMIDAPGREKPRFLPDKEPIAARAIAEALADLRLGPADLAICGGACGGDLLFAEAALARGARLELYIPFDEPTFLEKSVDFAHRDWRARYFAAKAPAALHVAPSELGPIREGADARRVTRRRRHRRVAPARRDRGGARRPHAKARRRAHDTHGIPAGAGAFAVGAGAPAASVAPADRGASEVIERPAARFGIRLESGLTGRMVEETRGADALPLLAYTLREMHEKYGGDDLLSVAEYEQLGGV